MADIRELTDEQLKKELALAGSAYKSVITDAVQRKKYGTLLEYIKTKKTTDPVKDQKRTALLIHESMRRQLRKQALLQFLYMEKSNDYGQMGEQRVSISFCRNILEIPAHTEVTQDDADRFREQMDEFEKQLGISAVAKIKDAALDFKLDFLGDSLALTDDPLVCEYLAFVGVPYRLFTGSMKAKIVFIYGQIEQKVISGKEISIVGKELVRSPHYVLSIAAGQGSGGVFIRKESCETIFYNKWAGYYSLAPFERQIYQAHPYSAIREGLKGFALKYYNVKDRQGLEAIKDTFIQEMIEGIFYHEVGHEVGEKDTIPYEEGRIGKSRGVVGDDIIVVLKEAIADWAPRKEKQSGPIWAFMQKARTDADKATRLLYVYLSDNWFIDAHDEFMGVQTDILCALIIQFIKPDGSFDFSAIEAGHADVFDFILRSYVGILSKIKDILHEGTYMAGIHRITFDMLEKELYKVYAKNKPGMTVEELRDKPSYWIHLLGLVKSFSPETHNKIDQHIRDSQTHVSLELLKMVSGGDTAKYNNSLREYIVQKMTEIGVYRKKALPEPAMIISGIAKDLKLPKTLEEKVSAQVQKIIDGDSIDIAISYEGKPDPFWAVFQELLLRSGAGNIRSGMAVGEDILANDPPEERKKKLLSALETIRDQIESEMYLEVKLLRVNERYIDQAVFDEVIKNVTFFDKTSLQGKIGSVQFLEVKTDRMMEAYVPLKRGFVDWNTSQAIWRINQELRPDDYLKQWTVDTLLMKFVLEAYMTSGMS